ncbi:MAG TPA: serine/threonine-protein kinase [Ktedonosporobacter sp.]|jgi:serine/threonine-protein kinase|nr:serine/threonine-protein kinase [Ktedonosporobacter sp.]
MRQVYHSGQQLGAYRLLQPLGQSGHSAVYLGEHLQERSHVAIKLLAGQRTEQEVAKFLTQASTLTLLRHAHIVQVLDYGIHDDTAFLVMAYAPNGTLRQRHPKGTPVPLATIVSYVNQVASALEYIHQRFLVHRDIKPHNMLLGSNNEVMLSDFGIAAVSHSIDPAQPDGYDFEGTVPYAAPEQLRGQPRRGSDQYALGIVVYEWLSGDWPFSGSFDEVTHQHMFAQPPSLRMKGIAITLEVEQVIMKALAKEPEKRFASITEFARALAEASRANDQERPSPQIKHLPSKRQFLSPLPFPRE